MEYYVFDVRDATVLEALIDDIYRRWGCLDGVIHGAGVVEDKLIPKKRPQSFARVLSTKVDSAFVLSRKLDPARLRFLVFFSSVSGRFGNRGQSDYAAANVPENELRNVHLRPFRAAVEAGVASVMTSFSELDGVPATASERLLRRILKEEWGFAGFVVSDWDSVRQLRVHGLTADDRASAREAAAAGVGLGEGAPLPQHGEELLDDVLGRLVVVPALPDEEVQRLPIDPDERVERFEIPRRTHERPGRGVEGNIVPKDLRLVAHDSLL